MNEIAPTGSYSCIARLMLPYRALTGLLIRLLSIVDVSNNNRSLRFFFVLCLNGVPSHAVVFVFIQNCTILRSMFFSLDILTIFDFRHFYLCKPKLFIRGII